MMQGHEKPQKMKIKVTKIATTQPADNNKASNHKDDKKPSFDEQMQRAIEKERSKR